MSETLPGNCLKLTFGKDQRMPATGFISYPTLSVSLTHYIREWVHIFMSMHAYHPPRFPPTRWHAHVFRKEAYLNKLFCLFLCLLSAWFVGSKSSNFSVLKTVIWRYLQWLSGMINLLLGALGCWMYGLYLVLEPHTPVRPAASLCMNSSTRYNPYIWPQLIT